MSLLDSRCFLINIIIQIRNETWFRNIISDDSENLELVLSFLKAIRQIANMISLIQKKIINWFKRGKMLAIAKIIHLFILFVGVVSLVSLWKISPFLSSLDWKQIWNFKKKMKNVFFIKFESCSSCHERCLVSLRVFSWPKFIRNFFFDQIFITVFARKYPKHSKIKIFFWQFF